jgi:hypothetical protein
MSSGCGATTSDGTIPFRGPGALRRRPESFATVGDGVKQARKGATVKARHPVEQTDGVPRAAFFFMIPVWLSLFSSEASTLAATGGFARASSQEN